MLKHFESRMPMGVITLLILGAMIAPRAAHAQYPIDPNALNYFVLTNTTYGLNGNYFVYVGEDSLGNIDNPGTGLPYNVTLDCGAGTSSFDTLAFNSSIVNITGGEVQDQTASFNTSTISIYGGSVDEGTNSFDKSTTNIGGGYVYVATSENQSTTNISNGTVYIAASYGTSLMNITGGTVSHAPGYNSSITDISGGTVSDSKSFDTSITNFSGGTTTDAEGLGSSLTNISGGTLTNGLFLGGSATANFIGSQLSYAYTGFGFNNTYNSDVDTFAVTGLFGGVSETYDLYVDNTTGVGDSSARQFVFNSGAVVPEAGTATLALPVIAMLGLAALVVRSRRRNYAVAVSSTDTSAG